MLTDFQNSLTLIVFLHCIVKLENCIAVDFNGMFHAIQ